MAVFYYFLFGMMLSDAGYGLVMVLGCGIILHKFKNMEEGLRKTLTMFLYCGISTIFWGILFGSFFGDANHRYRKDILQHRYRDTTLVVHAGR